MAVASQANRTSSLRLAELIAAISLATDLGMGQPMEQALRTCLLAIGLGRRLGLSDQLIGTDPQHRRSFAPVKADGEPATLAVDEI